MYRKRVSIAIAGIFLLALFVAIRGPLVKKNVKDMTAYELLKAMHAEESGGGLVVGFLRKVGVNSIPEFLHEDTDYDLLDSMRAAFLDLGPESVPSLIEALEDEDELILATAAYGLGKIGPEAREAVPALIETLKDEQEWIRELAASALHLIDPKPYP